MLISSPIHTACNLRGMTVSHRDHLRSPFKEANKSSTSLEGMEKPVRSFKSFIKTVPPNPSISNNKPLPPPPPTNDEPSPPSSTSPSSPHRTASVNSWIAPAEWISGSPSASPKQQDTFHVPTVPTGRTYSPLLPDPSPDLSDKHMEVRFSTLSQTGPSSQTARLLPIYERLNQDLGPPLEPPRSPLPLLPKSPGTPREGSVPARPRPGDRPPRMIPSKQKQLFGEYRTTSPATSTHSQVSNASTKEKAYASLGIGSPREQGRTWDESVSSSQSAVAPERVQPSRQHPNARGMQPLTRGSPLADDDWEGADMDDKMRQLSFSQDYHDLLAEQYHEMSVRPEEVLRSGPYQEKSDHVTLSTKKQHFSHDHELAPPPLSWRKSSNESTSRSASRNDEFPPTQGKDSSGGQKRHIRASMIRSWVPKRLGVAPHNPSAKGDAKDAPVLKKHKENLGKRIHGIRRNAASNEYLQFSNFFPHSAPSMSRKKEDLGAITAKPKESSMTAAVAESTRKMLRLPGGLAIVKTSPSTVAYALSEPSSPTAEHSIPSERPSTCQPSDSVSTSANCTSPASNQEDLRSSYTSSEQSGAHPPTVPKRDSLILDLPNATGATHAMPSPLPQTPTSLHPSLQNPPNKRGSWQPYIVEEDDEQHKTASFLEKAMEARRKHSHEARKEKLKKSIRVLGPTDPGVVAGYVRQEVVGGDNKRLPGYLVSGRYDE
ncbi:hypothetical protein BDV96DRAFT_643811 [Lophiotrema nucula]|uniref:Uncharacterized protein n=1 Tax=Lophiotrema nucula TaxID=690887 RepID=A0A6A5ZGG7_9PLEO|nr:hypothetical protein BDV96DRAFT_643811 [Lophiotrema nucula]